MSKMDHTTEVKEVTSFEPKIVAITCNFCTYAGADLAGTSRIQYPPNVRIIRVMCSGRVDPTFVLEALKEGADGVLIAGCHPGDCHFLAGNEKAARRYAILSKMLKQAGLEPERVRLEWISASEGEKFAKVIRSMVQDLKRVGPNPYTDGSHHEEEERGDQRRSRGEDILSERVISERTTGSSGLEIEGLLGAFRSEQVRWLVSREDEIKRNSGMSDQAFRQLLLQVVRREADRNIIVSQLKTKEGTIRDITASTRIPEKQILKHMIALMRRGSVAVVGEKEDEYVFAAVEPPE